MLVSLSGVEDLLQAKQNEFFRKAGSCTFRLG